MAKLETIKVVNEASDCGFMIINADDFDPEVHQEFEAEPAFPNRTGLEDVANVLGVQFSANIGDKKLAERVDAALTEARARAAELEIANVDEMAADALVAAIADAEAA